MSHSTCFAILILTSSLSLSATLLAQEISRPSLEAAGARERFPGEHWMQYVDVTEAGFSPKHLARAKRYWQHRDSSAFIAVSGGAVVAAWGEVDRRFPCHSVRKSFLSALYGVNHDAIDLESTLADLEIDDRSPLSNSEKQARLVDLISSRSGIYHEAAAEPREMASNRPARGSRPPGSHWWYNNWDFNAAGTAFEKLTGESIFEAFGRQIAEPIGMQDYRPMDGFYHYEPEKSVHPAYMFRMSTRDLARFGLLFARGGRWLDRQVIPEIWVTESTRSHSDVEMGSKYGSGYGYMWWIEDSGAFTARGTGGHILAVYPDRDLVMAIRADTYHEHSVPTRAAMRLFKKVVEAERGLRAETPRLTAIASSDADSPGLELSAEQLQAYAGTIEMDSGRKVTLTVAEDGPTLDYGQGTFRLRPQGESRFIAEDSLDPVILKLSEHGRLSEIWNEPLCYLEASSAAKRGDVETAITWVRHAVDKFPESARARVTLARALHGTGKSTEALAELQKALRIDPGNKQAARLHQRLQLRRLAPWAAGLATLSMSGLLTIGVLRRRRPVPR